MLFQCMAIHVWSPSEGFPRLSANCKILISRSLFQFSHSVLDWEGGRRDAFLQGSVGHIIYRDLMVKIRSLLFSVVWQLVTGFKGFESTEMTTLI